MATPCSTSMPMSGYWPNGRTFDISSTGGSQEIRFDRWSPSSRWWPTKFGLPPTSESGCEDSLIRPTFLPVPSHSCGTSSRSFPYGSVTPTEDNCSRKLLPARANRARRCGRRLALPVYPSWPKTPETPPRFRDWNRRCRRPLNEPERSTIQSTALVYRLTLSTWEAGSMPKRHSANS